MASNVLLVCFRGPAAFDVGLLDNRAEFRHFALVVSELCIIQAAREFEVSDNGAQCVMLQLCT